MKPLSWRSTAMWTAMPLMFLALTAGSALAGGVSPGAGLVLYEVTEDMYLLSRDGQPVRSLAQATRRSAVAQLTGFAKLGTPLCPWEVLMLTPGATRCTVNASGADNLSLADGKGTLGGTFAVVVQDTNTVDAPEFVVMTGSFAGAADLSLPFANLIFIMRPFFNAWDEQLPNAGRTEMPHRMKPAVPTVEVADHTDPLRVRRPDRETGARHTVDDAQF